jgi:cysteine synthase A
MSPLSKKRTFNLTKKMKYNNLNILNTVGDTPLIEVSGVYAKLETGNPTGSIKDRMVKHLVEIAEKNRELQKGSKIIEVTSGNTGISLAMISAVKGYHFTAVIPESMSIERRKMIKRFGADVILTPAEEDMTGAVLKYQEIIKKEKEAWLPNQFSNKENIVAHEEGIAKELIKQTNGDIDVFVAGVGTGGTLIGIAKALKKINKNIKIVAIEPDESAVLSGKKAGIHKIQGIGEGFVPKILKENLNLIDEVVTVSSSESIKVSQELSSKYGVLVGISSGANFAVSQKFTKKYKKVVTVFSDRAERYLI